jgi:hypothetical protein
MFVPAKLPNFIVSQTVSAGEYSRNDPFITATADRTWGITGKSVGVYVNKKDHLQNRVWYIYVF